MNLPAPFRLFFFSPQNLRFRGDLREILTIHQDSWDVFPYRQKFPAQICVRSFHQYFLKNLHSQATNAVRAAFSVMSGACRSGGSSGHASG